MSILDILINISITSNNKKHYEKILNKKLLTGETVEINQLLISKSSRQEVMCKCDLCGTEFTRKRIDVKTITLCGEKCRIEYFKKNNPNPKKQKIKVNCNICNKEIFIHESKFNSQKYFLCSRECYKKHRSLIYNTHNLYNYQEIKVKCSECGESFKTIEYDMKTRNNLFCSQECYWQHRRKNFTNLYSIYYKETNPERKVREYLSSHLIKFKQEYLMFDKYYVDFFLPDYKAVIEVYGDYWHVNPFIYGKNKKPLNIYQENKIKKDAQREEFIKNKGFSFFIIWESEINKDLDYFMGNILNQLYNKQESATTTRYTPTGT